MPKLPAKAPPFLLTFSKTIKRTVVPPAPKMERDWLKKWPEPHRVNPHPVVGSPPSMVIPYSFRGKRKEITIRTDPLDIAKIESETKYQYGGVTLHQIRFFDSRGKPWQRRGLIRIGENFYQVLDKWKRIEMEKNKKRKGS